MLLLQAKGPSVCQLHRHSRQSFAPHVNPRTRVVSFATVKFVGSGGEEIAVECAEGQYILDAGLNAGLELPYTCRGGICGACVGKVTKGNVDQSDVEDLSFCLDEGEIADGMALLCMARPVGDCTIETQSDYGYSLGIAEWKGATGKITGGKVEPLMGKKWEEIKQ